MNEPKVTAFKLTADQALLFFELCQELGFDDEPRRVALLHYLAQSGHVENVWTTSRSKEQLIKDLSLNFKVVQVKHKPVGFDTTKKESI